MLNASPRILGEKPVPLKRTKKQCSDQMPKGARDPVSFHNKLHHQHPPHAFDASLPNQIRGNYFL